MFFVELFDVPFEGKKLGVKIFLTYRHDHHFRIRRTLPELVENKTLFSPPRFRRKHFEKHSNEEKMLEEIVEKIPNQSVDRMRLKIPTVFRWI